ncbi:polysaccharide biosynthesis protein [Oligella urethralis]|uniref:oligosaccharide flippase family protein n=1 Tax=Oligella urethralis TaxID=90245 RepID=UPI000C9ABD32|nr:oligosaccharide flippase family protein [Oligella urethralis]PMC15699.1 polysaccharide biosynthesis protein [Oligella urethralis]
MRELIQRLLPKNAFARGVSVLVGGTVSAQALMILASPILTRLYSPEDFGLLAVYAGILGLFTVIASLRYELAIPLPEKDSEAANIAVLSLLIVIFFSIISAILILFWGADIAWLFGQPIMARYLWLLPVGVLAIGAYQVFNYWSVRTKSFGNIAKTRVRQSVAILVIQLSAFKLGALGLIVGQTTGQSVGVISLARPALKTKHFKGWRWGGLKRVAIRYKDFPIFSTWEGFLNATSWQAAPLLFAMLFSPTVAGFYALANRVLALPASLIGEAVGNVFFADAADAYREDKLAPLFESVYSKLVYIIMPVMLVLIIDAPRLFVFVFGERWEEAGKLAQWMSPWLAVVFIASPLSVMFIILEKQKQGAYFQSLMLLSRVLGIVVGFYYDSVVLAVILFSFLGMLCWVGFLVWVAVCAKSSLQSLYRPLLKSFCLSIVCVVPIVVNNLLALEQVYWYVALFLTWLLSTAYYVIFFKQEFI